MEILEALDQAFARTHAIIAGASPEQLGEPTPCAEWAVRDLLEHTIGVVAGMAAAAAGRPMPESFVLGAEPAAQFQEAAAAAMAAWRSPGAMDRIIDGGAGPMPGHVLAGINLLDTATHCWDLAKSTGQDANLPDDVAVAALGAAKMIVQPEIRTGRFGPEVTAEGAGPTEQLVAFLGRRPWTAGCPI